MDDVHYDQQGEGIWFVYDGDCPLCRTAALALRIRRQHGALHLLDARNDRDDPLLQEIARRNYDLDEGMVIWCAGRFYHGADALCFMAQFAESSGFFNRVNRLLFSSERSARLCYPWLRAMRNLLVRIRGAGKLDNLRDSDAPLFKSVFGACWDELPAVIRRHYANRPFRDDVVRVAGTLNVRSSPLGRLLKPAFRLTGALVPYEGDDIPVTVDFVTQADSAVFRFERIFHFPGKPPYRFQSAMVPIGGNELVEMMGFGFGWRLAYGWDGEKVILAHRGYVLKLFGTFVPVPLALLIGKGYAEEHPLSDDMFSMWTEIRHPWWGTVFGYDGTFGVTRDR
jgi:predicted DCC family thiol-disulfide oxidoreductase YuxK